MAIPPLLSGLRVLDLTRNLPGPFATRLLADLGATIVKVEPPEGDTLRQWPPIRQGDSENFASLNRSKRSIALDLKTEEGKKAFVELAKTPQTQARIEHMLKTGKPLRN